MEENWPAPQKQTPQKPLPPVGEAALSVIIPVYNAESYLRACLDSVLDQKCPWPVEVIAVNDGSKDGSAAILAEYKAAGKIQVLTKENGGLSSARNAGIEASHGRYLTFLDSDDLLTDGSMERALKKALDEDCDIVQMQYIRLSGETEYPSGVRLPDASLTEYAEMCRIPGHACMKLYRRELFEGLRFPEGYWFEDTIVHLILFQKCRKMGFVPEPGYVYRYNTQGISYKKHTSLKCLEAYYIVPRVLELRNELGLAMNQTAYEEVLFHFAGLLYHRIRSVDPPTRQAVFLLCCETVQGLNWPKGRTTAEPMQSLEQAFWTKDYGLWELCCQCF